MDYLKINVEYFSHFQPIITPETDSEFEIVKDEEDNTGTLSTYEFKRTWLKVKNYMNIFRSADVDGSGSISSPEFRNALKEAGFTLGDGNFDAIVDRCMDRTQLQFVEFLTSIANLETLFKMFKTLDRNQSESIKLSVYEWLCLGLSYERL
ncbi:hypothetical protein GDO81_008843 [Engystomops pustulosus]|uniref:EF-hand domain-containing protein n=1 Tax=Engystomops pustulosus TaxID=76066 RepID=A0AAV7CHE2_ENGPU|nr:hypothetical protein GDO81_008843 [Engystomops pustulosus]